jgi:DNA-binding protein WhiA
MSFSSDVKHELSQLIPDEPCCKTAEAYGLVECGHTFSPSSISLNTESSDVFNAYLTFISSVCNLEPSSAEISVRASGIHTIRIPEYGDRLKILEHFGHSPSDVTIRLNRANLECELCAAAYLRGAFLSCGALTDPNSDYHMELSVPYYRLSMDIMSLMRELNFNVKLVKRKGSNVLYLKESGQIEDCLTMMGATKASLEIMGIKVVKNIRNTANRIANCENANIDKIITAALKYSNAIRKIESQIGLDSLPDELHELALLRLDNPDMSLRELGEMLNTPLSRSGVNHRLNKILKIADQLG